MKKVLALISSLFSSLLLSLVPCFWPATARAEGPNLISNPSVETQTASGPADWLQGRWLTNAQFSVPTNGHTGSRSLQVNITSYGGGDAKWYFKQVNVSPNTQYVFRDYYKASVGTGLTAEITSSTGQVSYQWLGSVPASSTWQQASVTFTTPADAQRVSVYHALSAVGSLQTDDFTLATTAATNPDPNPVPNPSSNIVPNASVETVDPANSSRPQHWSTNNWGNNSARFSYLNSGHTGSRSVRTQVTRYTNGDAKWHFAAQTVSPNTTYTFSDYYQSTGRSDVGAMVTDTSGNSQYIYLGSAPISSSWSKFEKQFTTPANARSVTILHALVAVGTLTVDDYSVTPYTAVGFASPLVSLTFDDSWRDSYEYGLPIMQNYNYKSTFYLLSGLGSPEYMTTDMIVDLKNKGHEVASHTISHPHLPQLSASELDRELRESQLTLQGWTGAPVNNFASPYGEYNDTVINNIKRYYRSHRSVDVGFNSKSNFNIYNLKVQNISSTTTAQQVAQWVSQAQAEKSWLILVYHRVNPNTNAGSLNATPANFDAQLAAIQSSGVSVVTVEQALNQLVPQL